MYKNIFWGKKFLDLEVSENSEDFVYNFKIMPIMKKQVFILSNKLYRGVHFTYTYSDKINKNLTEANNINSCSICNEIAKIHTITI